MVFVMFWILFSALIGMYASKLERSFMAYFLLSCIFSPLLILVVLLIIGKKVDDSKFKKCAKCAEKVLVEAKVCRFCGNDFYQTTTTDQPETK